MVKNHAFEVSALVIKPDRESIPCTMPLVNLLEAAPSGALKLPKWVRYETALQLITKDRVESESEGSESEGSESDGSESDGS